MWRFFLTNTCNMKCSFCGAWNQDNAGEFIDLEKVKEIILHASKKGYRYISFSGGEPLQYKYIYDVIEYANNLGFFINLTTNGLLIDDSFVKNIGNKNVNTRISFHSLNKDLFNGITGRESSDKVRESIQRLKKEKIVFSIGATIFEDNINEVQALAQFALEEGAEYIRFTPVYRVYKGRNFNIDSIFFERLLFHIVKFALGNKKSLQYKKRTALYLSNFINIITTKQCAAGSDYYIAVNPDLNIVSCPVLPHYSGSYTEKYSSFENIESLKGYYKNLLTKELVSNLKGQCRDCKYKHTCKGGCISTKLEEQLSLEEEQPICLMKIVNNVLDKLSPREMEDIISYWKYQYDKKVMFNDDSSGCIRRLPIWELHFNNKYSYDYKK
ncbi:radical SAM/SPASM domain-containing protein [Clostridium polynesiense]|uniref:radical SAM/SPASM domain-containing protein n=1 Tax=Clostridium polynesiense TaxID=1325933 RepID=UPI002418AB76|nr:radical SAM protein [Clostridium polynesiense]